MISRIDSEKEIAIKFKEIDRDNVKNKETDRDKSKDKGKNKEITKDNLKAYYKII